MTDFVRLYLLSMVVFFGLDLIWLGVIADGFYDAHLGHLLAEQVNWGAALAFYLVFVAGIVHFVTMPAIQNGNAGSALLNGGAFGLVTYAAFDLTCMALFADFPAVVVVVDLAWGVVLVGSVAYAGARLAGRVGVH
ncbi:MAG: DUF2177 family protein [Rhodothermales bacterium]|nr:DUF2177 family protein [Rhodothermales bacterium]